VEANSTLHKKIIALAVLLVLGVLMIPAAADSPGNGGNIHVDKIVVVPSGPDLKFTVYYDTSFFTKLFSMIFGAQVIQPSIQNIFANFTNVTVASIDVNNCVADVIATNQSTLSDNGWYVYGGTATFPVYIDTVEVYSSDGTILTINNTNTIPVMTNLMPSYGNSTNGD